MDRIWQWAWDRHGPRYSWALCAITSVVVFPIYLLFSLPLVAAEEPGRYAEAAAATVIAVLVLSYVLFPCVYTREVMIHALVDAERETSGATTVTNDLSGALVDPAPLIRQKYCGHS